MFLVWILPIIAFTSIEVNGKRHVPQDDFKHERVNDKFVLTSTAYEEGVTIFPNNGVPCLKIDIHVPENYDPLPVCLKEKLTTKNLGGFDKKFRLVNTEKVSTLSEVLEKNKVVEGYVIGMGLSYVNGYLKNNEFYGTLVYSHFIRDQNIMCSILPLSLLPEFVDLSKMNDKEKEEFIYSKTVFGYKKARPNAIVTCGDMHRNDNDDIKLPFSFTGPHNPTNVKVKKVLSRRSRQADDQTAPLPPPDAGAPVPPDLSAPAPLPPAAPLPPDMKSDNSNASAPTQTKKAASKSFSRLMKKDKHGTYYATVCYIVDAGYLSRRFNGSAEEATLLLGGFVELTDWILRATDWDNDGIPENIGVRLLEVRIDFMTRELKIADEKWGRSDGGNFMKRTDAFKIVREAGKLMATECDIRSGIGEINVAKYVLHEPGGCTACKHNLLTSFVNPYVEKFSPRGEQIRLLYHEIRILTFALVYTKGYCTNCTGALRQGFETKESSLSQTFETNDMDWGACIVEGDVQSRSNIPLNSFRLSVCSKENGASCLKDIAHRNNCMQFEPEESYCGNGIIEGDEECDCGTLATCVEQQCVCSPRSGRDPCRKLSPPDSKVCFALIRCRGFRFLYELGHANGSSFMAAFGTFADGTHYKMGDRNRLKQGGSAASTLKVFKMMYTYIFVYVLIRFFAESNFL